MNALVPLSLACFHCLFAKRCVSANVIHVRCLPPLQLYIGEACWAFLFGVIIGKCILCLQIFGDRLHNSGPYGAGIFDPRSWANGNEQVSNTVTLEFTRVVLAIGVFAIGVELPKAYVARHWKSLLFLLGPVMAWVRRVYLGYHSIPQANLNRDGSYPQA